VGYCRQIALPIAEPVTPDTVKRWLKLPDYLITEDDFISGFIQAAREQGEIYSCRSLAKRQFVQVLDSHPYYTDTVGSQLAYPPSYYSLPRYSTTLWNYSQMIKLGYSPVISVESMRYIGTDGNPVTLHQDVDFVLDRIAEPARIFPRPGQYWPANLYVANAVEIVFTAGYDPNPAAATDTHVTSPPGSQQPDSTIVTAIPHMHILGILNLVAYWYNNRGSAGKVPDAIAQIFMNNAVVDWAPTRG